MKKKHIMKAVTPQTKIIDYNNVTTISSRDLNEPNLLTAVFPIFSIMI